MIIKPKNCLFCGIDLETKVDDYPTGKFGHFTCINNATEEELFEKMRSLRMDVIEDGPWKKITLREKES